MSDTTQPPEPVYHLILDSDEALVAVSALDLFISDVAGQPDLRRLAREVLAELAGERDTEGRVTVSLAAGQMKITHSAVRLLFDDLQAEQAGEREVLRAILDKLPDEHTMRAIVLP